MEVNKDIEQENRLIRNAYGNLLRSSSRKFNRDELKLIRKAFTTAMEAHKDMRRKSGEPYIFHPLGVAKIVAADIGLGVTSIICALLHDTVEDTDLTLDTIERLFGEEVRQIIDGLTKISSVFDMDISRQAENFRKMLLTISNDVRVILIKLADRLHNMRTLYSMRPDKQVKIASETLFLYAPLAHRFGLYNLKSELEDLSIQYTQPEAYNEITKKLKKIEAVRARFIRQFCLPIKRGLDATNIEYSIKGRPKSIFSILNKMQTKDMKFEEVYDVFAVRIVIKATPEHEKALCWHVYSVVTDSYLPNPERLRDWISHSKQNGYESLHITVMSPTGKWVEVQIRTERMNEIAEKGFAAHWKYKEHNNKLSTLDEWLQKIRNILEDPGKNAIDFVGDFKLNLYSGEIFVFTPKGELKRLPRGATTLDFAYEIHTEVGSHCIGAKVNQKLEPLSHVLRSGDQIEILTSSKQKPKNDWLNIVITGKAKLNIRAAIKEESKKLAIEGKEILKRKLKALKVKFTSKNIDIILRFMGINETTDLYCQIANGTCDLSKIKKIIGKDRSLKDIKKSKVTSSIYQIVKKIKGKSGELVLGNNLENLAYKLSVCCHPIPGDEVFGFITINEGIKIHRTGCPNAIQLISNFAYRIVKARWTGQEDLEFLTGIKINGIDDIGLVNAVTTVISNELNVNMQSLSFESKDGTFDGKVIAYVKNTKHLNKLLKNLASIKGVISIERMNAH